MPSSMGAHRRRQRNRSPEKLEYLPALLRDHLKNRSAAAKLREYVVDLEGQILQFIRVEPEEPTLALLLAGNCFRRFGGAL